jgi:hypothetical protein
MAAVRVGSSGISGDTVSTVPVVMSIDLGCLGASVFRHKIVFAVPVAVIVGVLSARATAAAITRGASSTRGMMACVVLTKYTGFHMAVNGGGLGSMGFGYQITIRVSASHSKLCAVAGVSASHAFTGGVMSFGLGRTTRCLV